MMTFNSIQYYPGQYFVHFTVKYLVKRNKKISPPPSKFSPSIYLTILVDSENPTSDVSIFCHGPRRRSVLHACPNMHWVLQKLRLGSCLSLLKFKRKSRIRLFGWKSMSLNFAIILEKSQINLRFTNVPFPFYTNVHFHFLSLRFKES